MRTCFEKILRADALPSLRRRLAWASSGGPIHALVNCVCLYDLHVDRIYRLAYRMTGDGALAESNAIGWLAAFFNSDLSPF